MQYKSQLVIKGEALAEFIMGWIENKLINEFDNASMEVVYLGKLTLDFLMVYVDEDCNSKGLRVRIATFTPQRGLIEQCIKIAFLTTNNVVKYEVLLLVLYKLCSLEAKKVLVHSDSRLIVN